MKRLGFDIDAIQQDVPDFTKEMQKIQGYPVIIDGKYYATKQGGEEDAGRVCQESFEEIKKTGQQ
ncbi:MAG: hypothetical protein WBB73_05815 [Candidatus Aminicenantaceae bacterium]